MKARTILAAGLLAFAGIAGAADRCDTSQFVVVSKAARANNYGEILITVAVRNDNRVACSPKVQVSVTDKSGKLVGTRDTWVVTENYAPGVTRNVTLTLPADLMKAAAGGGYHVEPIESRVWSAK